MRQIIPRPFYVILQSIPQAAGDRLAAKSLILFLLRLNQNDNTLAPLNWAMFGLLILTESPLTATMIHYVYNDHLEEVNDDDLLVSLEKQELESHDHVSCHHTLAECTHKLIELVAFALSYGLIGAAGVFELLSPFCSSKEARYVNYAFSAGFGAINWWSNFKLHDYHLHAKEGYFTLLKKIPVEKRFKALYLSLGVGLGHVFQGFLAGRLFQEAIGTTNIVAQIIFPSLSAISLGVSETVTEMTNSLKSMLPEEREDNQTQAERKRERNQPWQVKIGLLPSSTMHGLIAAIGFIVFSCFVWQHSKGQELSETLPWYGRTLLCIFALFFFGYPNARGFYDVTKNPTNIALKKLCSCLSWTQRDDALEDRRIIHPDENNVSPRPRRQLSPNGVKHNHTAQNSPLLVVRDQGTSPSFYGSV